MKDNDFVKSIKPNFYSTSDDSVLEALFSEYEKVIFRSLFTAFGLDIFIQDNYGGDVDTIQNVREIGTDNNKPGLSYKNSINEKEWSDLETYSRMTVENMGTVYQQKKHNAHVAYKENPRENTVLDEYENKPLHFLADREGHPTEKTAELDHVLSVKSIHDDRGRLLAGLKTCDLADAETNLKWTNEHLNKSMKADEIPVYIEKHPELSDDVKNRMMDAYHQAKAEYERKINKAYYLDFSNPHCRQFYQDVLKSSGKRGVQMGLRQTIGFLTAELWFEIKEQLQGSDSSLTNMFSAVGEGVKHWVINVRENYTEIIIKFGEGIIGGIISSFTTTFMNVFVTTSEHVGRIIRQTWASVVEAVSELFFNTKEKYLCDRMTSAAKVLATGASMIIGTSVQDAVRANLSAYPITNEIIDIVATFAGCLCTGVLTVTLLFYIDNNPFEILFDNYLGLSGRELKKQGELFKAYCTELKRVDLSQFKHETEYVFQLSTALNNANNNMETNELLRKAIADLGLQLPWGEGSLRETMKDSEWELHFGGGTS